MFNSYSSYDFQFPEASNTTAALHIYCHMVMMARKEKTWGRLMAVVSFIDHGCLPSSLNFILSSRVQSLCNSSLDSNSFPRTWPTFKVATLMKDAIKCSFEGEGGKEESLSFWVSGSRLLPATFGPRSWKEFGKLWLSHKENELLLHGTTTMWGGGREGGLKRWSVIIASRAERHGRSEG